jgi:multidrug resistance protein, MATE family
MHGTEEHRRRRHKREVALEGALDGNTARVAVPVETTADDDSSPTPASVRPEAQNTCTAQVNAPTESATRELLTLAWPIAAAMLGETALGLVDTKLVGGLGSAALGGVGMGITLMYLGYALLFGVMRGVKVRSAHAVGSGRRRDGVVYAKAGVLLGATGGAVIFAVTRDASPLLYALGADAEIVPYARDFLAAVTFGAPAAGALSALIQHRQGVGDTRTPMVVGLAGNTFNAVLAWALIYGRLGLPRLGVRGGGYATALTLVLELAVLLWLLAKDDRRGGSLPSGAPLSLRQATREVVELGLPTGAQFGAETLAFTAFTALLGGAGKEQIAAHQIGLAVIRTSFLPGAAIAEAASVMVGRSLGARRLDAADRAAKSAVIVAVAFMASCGVVFAVFGGALARTFTRDAEVVAIAQKLLLLAAAFQVLDAVNIVYRGALRGAKDVRVAALVGSAVVWLFIPTSALVLGRWMGWGALGGWVGFVGETTVGALVLWLRWTRGGWRRAYAS